MIIQIGGKFLQTFSEQDKLLKNTKVKTVANGKYPLVHPQSIQFHKEGEDGLQNISTIEESSLSSQSCKKIQMANEKNKENFNMQNVSTTDYWVKGSFDSEGQLTINQEAKIQIMKQLKIFFAFQKWKNLIKQRLEQQIDLEEEKVKREIRTKYQFFTEWKRTAIGEKRAGIYHRKKVYRAFIMKCTSLLHLRLKTIYCEEILKKMRLPHIILSLQQNLSRNKILAKKIAFRRLSQKIKKQKYADQIKNSTRCLALLHYNYSLKRRAWKALS